MAVGDVYCLKMFQTLYLQNVLNVFFYRQTLPGTPDDAEGLFRAFDEDVLSDFVNCVLNQLDIIRLEVFDPSNPTDFFDGSPVNNVGTRVAAAGNRSPSYLSFGFRSNRAGPGTRASFKRFAGLQELDIDANSLQPSFTTLPAVIDLTAALGVAITQGGAGAVYQPVQVKHPVPLGIPVIENFEITSWSVPFATSQVSRKPPAGS